MRKYWAVIRLGWEDFFYRRTRAIIWILVELITPLAMVFIFRALTIKGNQIAGYGYTDFFFYYFCASLVSMFLPKYSDEEVAEQIKDGSLSYSLLRPISHRNFILAGVFSWHSAKMILYLPFLLVFFLAFSSGNIFPDTIFTLWSVLAVTLAFFLAFIFSYAFGMLSFWFLEINGLKNFKDVSVMLLSGQILPLSFLPAGFLAVNNFLPFKYWLFFPVSLMQGKLNNTEIATGF
ncbi:MAG: ABC-2 family transporter protein, partial [bacterium]|nr:ABC-2 family transporter protein [bacterium]